MTFLPVQALATDDTAAQTPQRRLQDFHAAGAEQYAELRLGREALAGGKRDPHLPRHLGKLEQVVGRDGLFVPQGVVGLEFAAHADRAGRGELPVRAE